MQLSELISAVRDELQDTVTKRWSDATIRRHLNNGQLDLARTSKAIDMWEQNIFAGDTGVLLPSDILIPKSFWFEVGSWRYPLDIKYGVPIESSSVIGDPLQVYIFTGTVTFYPTVQRNGKLYVMGTRRPVPMSADTDIPSVLDADDALILFAVWKCLASDGDPNADSRKKDYTDARMEWSILDAQRNPMPDRIERNEWW